MPSSYSIGDRFERFVRDQVESGRYNNASEVLRAGLRLLENEERSREEQLAAFRAAIEKGLASGPTSELDFKRLRSKARRRLDAEDLTGDG
jgi:antitoxin ParD1/3/4